MIHELSDFERRIVENIRQHGCHINFVYDDEDGDPGFCYSVGFWKTADQPEAIVFGLSQNVMQFMINETLRKCLDDGLELRDGTVLDGLLEGHSVVARAVHPSQMTVDYFNSAMWHRRHSGEEGLPNAVQLVWPSAGDGLFPWDEGCSEIVRQLQPALYRPEFDA